MIAQRNHSVFSRRLSVNPEFHSRPPLPTLRPDLPLARTHPATLPRSTPPRRARLAHMTGMPRSCDSSALGITRIVSERLPASGATPFTAHVTGCRFAPDGDGGCFGPRGCARPPRLGPAGLVGRLMRRIHVTEVRGSPFSTSRSAVPRPGRGVRRKIQLPGFGPSAYYGCMTTRQAPKRPGSMNPAPRLSAALTGGVVAG